VGQVRLATAVLLVTTTKPWFSWEVQAWLLTVQAWMPVQVLMAVQVWPLTVQPVYQP
jgi:hypothetical protein